MAKLRGKQTTPQRWGDRGEGGGVKGNSNTEESCLRRESLRNMTVESTAPSGVEKGREFGPGEGLPAKGVFLKHRPSGEL